jgi:hypothetical protein
MLNILFSKAIVLFKTVFTSNAGKVRALERPGIAPENTGVGLSLGFVVIV